MPVNKQSDGRYRARYFGPDGKERSRIFTLKKDAEAWLGDKQAKARGGTWVPPAAEKLTVKVWCEQWLTTYGGRKRSTVRMAEVHVAKIVEAFGRRRLDSIRPSEIEGWVARLKAEGTATSYVYALHARFAQIYASAIRDGLVARSPLSRDTSPPTPRQRPYVASTEQIWGLHDKMAVDYRAGVLLGAFAGLRLAEVCGLRVEDIDFTRGIVHPTVQYPADTLKTECSQTPIPIPHDLALTLSAHVAEYSTTWLLTDAWGHQMAPWTLQREFRRARGLVKGLPDGFRFQDLRHYYASLLIASGLDVKTVQTRMRHASAKTTLDTYTHLFPDRDDSTREAVGAVFGAKPRENRDDFGTIGGDVLHLP